jgi:transcriptional regulator NrdR family protein
MKCHNCQAKTEVEETRVIEENPRWTKRRRVCKNCGFTLWTVEMPAEDVVVKEENGDERTTLDYEAEHDRLRVWMERRSVEEVILCLLKNFVRVRHELRQAAEMAYVTRRYGGCNQEALRQALAPEVTPEVNEPEGWVKIDEVRQYFDSVGCGTIYKTAGEDRVPLYAAPPKREWVGLTKEDFYKKDDETVFVLGMKFAEARLKEKNT